MSDSEHTEQAGRGDHADRAGQAGEGAADRRTRFSPGLMVAGVAALAIALWAIAGGPRLLDSGTLLGVLAIGAVAVAGVMLIVRPGGKDTGPH
ncbi:hypothetical protein [Tsukamurella sp. 1534]|uniref:hypothetical protein n=1 Tax=Tsukamurella sp. 1534 TaxID=1151061 RepID=UPI0002E4DA62|nr:hypothetical protein [Tsukamurella sp. 1534]